MAQSFHEAKRPKNSSDRAIKLKRKRAIEKFFSQDQEAAQKKKKSSDTETEDEATSDIEFEVVEPSNLPGINIFTAQLFLLLLRNNYACCYISFHFLPVK